MIMMLKCIITVAKVNKSESKKEIKKRLNNVPHREISS